MGLLVPPSLTTIVMISSDERQRRALLKIDGWTDAGGRGVPAVSIILFSPTPGLLEISRVYSWYQVPDRYYRDINRGALM